MAEIRLLDSAMINKIAAGEVVERPSSIVKELTENAIDSGATSITVETEGGGISMIRVTDNGCGIPKTQVRTAFMRHATSKIADFDDLERVMTMGFRGEALSSVAGVSIVELITKTTDETVGTKIEISGGTVVSESDAGCAQGTTIIVRSLFFNVPARRKFLKKASVEGGYISDLMRLLAVGNIHIAFRYIADGETVFNTSGKGNLQEAVLAVYGRDTAKSLIGLDIDTGNTRFYGAVARPEFNRANRSYGSFFLNGRLIKSPMLQSAVETAYKTRLPIGKFPVFIINIETDPANVDVNVHPAKTEVRFSDEKSLFEELFEAVSKTLQGENLIRRESLHQTHEQNRESEQYVQGDIYKISVIHPSENVPVTADCLPEPKKDTVRENTAAYTPCIDKLPESGFVDFSKQRRDENGTLKAEVLKVLPETENTVPVVKSAEYSDRLPFFHDYQITGQIFANYWIIEQNSSMYLIDQHAAHERVLYEEITARLNSGESLSQMMAFPQAINLSDKEFAVMSENADMFDEFGFEYEILGKNMIALRSVPYIFSKPANTGFFMDIIDRLGNKREELYQSKLNEIAMIACKAAVKANDRLNYTEAKALITRLLSLENPFNCPHGRPTVIEITKAEIEKKFLRLS